METLLSLAFDNLSAYDGPKVKKGLKQVEGLLAPICLSVPRRPASSGPEDASWQGRSPYKTLAELAGDPAFFEFFKLQEGFEWNVAHRLLDTLDRLMARGSDGQNDLLIMSTLDLIQGVLLLHPPSKGLFAREKNMNVGIPPLCSPLPPRRGSSLTFAYPPKMLLDLLEPCNCPAVQSATLLTLVVALIDTPQNTRAFEALDGLLTVTSLFKSRSTSRDVKLKLVEFLYFYLMPETPSIARADARDSVPAMLQRSPSKLARAFTVSAAAGGTGESRRKRADSVATRSTEEKQALLGQHLHNVEGMLAKIRPLSPVMLLRTLLRTEP